MKSKIYRELKARYRVWDVYLGAFCIALILVGGAYMQVKAQKVVREWDSLEAKMCLIP